MSSSKTLVNRELSTIAFNERVLALATNEDMPLLERLRYLAIVSSNLDEFFEVRVGGVKQRNTLGLSMRRTDEMTPRQLLSAIRAQTAKLVHQQYDLLNHHILRFAPRRMFSLEEVGVD